MARGCTLKVIAWAVPVVIAAMLPAAPAAALERARASLVVLEAGPPGLPTLVAPDARADVAPQASTFRVTYRGFTPAARAAFQRAVNVWSRRISSPVPITVSASFESLGSGVLGAAGPNYFWRDLSGFPRSSTYYADALANRRARRQLDPSPDIIARFSSNFPNWHFGTGRAPAGTYDFTSVVLHELGHGLGFIGSAGLLSNTYGYVGSGGLPFAYDLFIETRGGARLLGFPDFTVEQGRRLRSGNLFFDSQRVRRANGGLRARIYAPSVFRPGSSYSHLDEATYLRGNRNSLMTPQLGQSETIRDPGPITLAIFRTLGW